MLCGATVTRKLYILLEKVQTEATRIITGLRANSSKSILYIELGWETLQSQRISN